MPTHKQHDYEFKDALQLLNRLVEALKLEGPVRRVVLVAEAQCVPRLYVERYLDDAGARAVAEALAGLEPDLPGAAAETRKG